MSGVPRISGRAAGLILGCGLLSAGLSALLVVRSRARTTGPLPEAVPAAGPVVLSATPEAVARLEARKAEIVAHLRPAADFDAWLRRWSDRWTPSAVSSELRPGVEIRHYAIDYRDPDFRRWPDIARSIAALCGEPGIEIDTLALATGTDDADRFVQAELTFTVRLRR